MSQKSNSKFCHSDPYRAERATKLCHPERSIATGFINRTIKLCHPERSVAIGFINRTIKLCHPERSVAIGEANRNAKSRDLLSSAARAARKLRLFMPQISDSGR